MEGSIFKKTIYFQLFLLLIAGIFLRLVFVSNHFPHYDDLWGYYRTLGVRGLSNEEFIARLPSKIGILINSLPQKLAFIFSPIIRHFSSVYSSVNGTTLAPLHYFFSGFIAFDSGNYKLNLVLARALSLAEYIGFFAIALRLSKIFSKDLIKLFYVSILALSLISFHPVILSIQGHSYMAAILGMGVLISLLGNAKYQKSINTQIASYSLFVINGIIFLPYLPSFLLTQILAYRMKKTNPFRSIGFYLSLIILGISIALVYLIFMSSIHIGSGTGYQGGPNNEYMFTSKTIISSFNGAIFALFKTLNTMFLSPSSPLIVSSLFTAFILLTIIYGLIDTLINFQSRINETSQLKVIYVQLLLANHFLLYLFGKLAISPTRHSLILYLPIVIASAYGLDKFISTLGMKLVVPRNKNNLSFGSLLIVKRASSFYLLILSTFLFLNLYHSFYYWLPEMAQRFDPLTSDIIDALKNKQTIVYDKYWNFSLNIHPTIRANFEERKYPDKVQSIYDPSWNAQVLISRDRKSRGWAYVSNNPETPTKSQIMTLASSTGCKKPSNHTELISHATSVGIDPEYFANYVATNSLYAVSVDCAN